MFVWFVKVKIDRYLHISNSYLHMFPLPACFKRCFWTVWVDCQGYIYYTQGRARRRQTGFCDGVGSLSQIQIPKISLLYINDTINNFQCITSAQCTLSVVVLSLTHSFRKKNMHVLCEREWLSSGLLGLLCGIMRHRIKWRAYLT
jgi:hypothetical protein